MKRDSLEFYFEFASTYSYLAVMRIEKLARGTSILWKPFLLGPLFKEFGWNDSPFNIYPIKGRYMWRDMERLCQKYDLPFRKPSQFSRNGLAAARIAHLTEGESWNPEFVRLVFKANFVEDRDIANTQLLVEILSSLKQDGAAILEQSQSQENKVSLQRRTEEVKSLGIFGAPSFVVAKELFWGHDRIGDALELCR